MFWGKSNFSGNVGVIFKKNLIVFNLLRLLVKLFMDWLNKNSSEVKTYLLVVDNSLTSSCVYNDPLYYPAAFVDKCSSHATILPVLRQFYNSIGINYYRLVSFAIEKRVRQLNMDVAFISKTPCNNVHTVAFMTQ